MRPEHWIYTVPLRLRSLFRQKAVEQELAEELGYHVERKTEEYLAKGLSAEEAREAATREFGGVEQAKEECRDTRKMNWYQDLGKDLSYALRVLRKSPGFAAMAVFTLALGIGGNATIFSLVEGILLRQPPYPHPERVVMIWEKRVHENELTNPVSPADYLDWQKQSQNFSSMAALSYTPADLTGGAEPLRVPGATVGAEFFDVLGVHPALGRFFEPSEEQPGSNFAAVLSYGLWQSRFGGDPQIVGQAIRVNGKSATVIGVLPEDFRFPYNKVELWMPLTIGGEFAVIRGSHFLNVFARLKPGVSLLQAQAEMVGIAGRLEKQNPGVNRGHGASVLPLREELVRDIRPALNVVGLAVGFVLLIACANIANLFLARGIRRQREIALRQAVGASRWRLVRQMLVESLLIAALAGTAGCMPTVWGISGLADLLRQGGWEAPVPEFRLNGAVVAFLAVVSLGSSLLTGLMPALTSSQLDVVTALKGEGTFSRLFGSSHRLRAALLISEVMLSTVLLIGASLLLRTFFELRAVTPGFHGDRVMALPVFLNSQRHADPQRRVAFFEELMSRVASMPGVESAGGIDILPMSGEDSRTRITIENRAPSPNEPTRAHHRIVTPGYFATMDIPLQAGRTIQDSDTPTSPPVAVINETAAQKYWPEQSAVGKRFKVGGQTAWREIVGVVGDVKEAGLAEEVKPVMYLPLPQDPTSWWNVVVRTQRDPSDVGTALKSEVQAIDKDQPVGALVILNKLVSDSIASQKINLLLVGLFAGVALVLAAGIYSVMAFAFAQRTPEIGIRMALGANENDVLRLVLGQGAKLAGAGLALGMIAALGLTRLMRSLLFGVSATDPLTFVGVTVLLTVVALAACYIPARKAMRVDPLVALRYE